MSYGIHLAVDAMGGDQGPRLSVSASLEFLQQFPDSQITLVGDNTLIGRELAGRGCTRLSVVHANDEVTADEKPTHALRHKRESSLWKCLALLADAQADAAVSGGNTGALMAMAKHIIGTFAGLDRPAICKPVPTEQGVSYLLDLGANLECTSGQLVQFALMGASLARTSGVAEPTVALLNVGIEDTKGSSVVRRAAEQLQQLTSVNFVGYVEGDGVYSGETDVVVCDGFAGNVLLKASEGAARLIFSSLRQELGRGLRNRLGAKLAEQGLQAWGKKFSPSRYNGAALLGLHKTVIKSHGSADLSGFCQALGAAREQVIADVPGGVERNLAMMKL